MRTLTGWVAALALASSAQSLAAQTEALPAPAAVASPAVASPAAVSPAGAPAASEPVVPRPSLAVGTQIRLMILREVTSRTAKPGDRIRLRVTEPVIVDGVAVVPVGATAWGEVVGVEGNGAAGVSGRLSARLLHLVTPDGPVPLEGAHSHEGDTGGAALALAILGFGPLGLLHQGDSGRLKAGDIINGRVVAPSAERPAVVPVQAVPGAPLAQ
jgi:hypothetical protein